MPSLRAHSALRAISTLTDTMILLVSRMSMVIPMAQSTTSLVQTGSSYLTLPVNLRSHTTKLFQ